MTSPTTTTPAARPKLPPVPAGAAGWSRTYVDAKGLPQKSETPVPVDANERITAHVRHTCRGHIMVGQQKTPNGPLVEEKQPCPEVKWLLPGEKVPFCSDHGEQLRANGEKPKTPLVPWAAIVKAAEPAARPWWALLAEGVGAAAVQGGHVPWWALLPAAPALAVSGYWAVRYHLTKRALKAGDLEKGQRSGRHWRRIARRARTGAYMGAAAGAWLPAWAAADPASIDGVTVGAAGLLTWAVASATWWNYQSGLRNRPVVEPAVEQSAVKVEPSADELAAADAAKTWDTEVAITGTHANPATWKRIKGGFQIVIVATKRGALNALGGDNMKATIRRIAAAFDVPRAAIGWIEEYEDSPNRALLLVQPDSPLKDDITWQPPGLLDVDKALLHMGMRFDGTELRTRLWTPGWGAPSRWIVGTKGSGKTEALRLLLLGMLEAQVMGPSGPRRLVAPFLHDPKRGKDFGAFRRQVSGFSTDPQCLHMIVEAIIREMDRRYDSLGSDVWFDEHGRPREGETAFDPTIHGPIISLIIDEFHEPAKDSALMAKLDPTGRKMRAAGIEVVGASHMSTISDTGSQVFRDMMAGGEAWLFRTTSGLNAQLATGGQLVGDPRGLPREPGSVLVASGDEDTMQARTAYVPSEPLYDRLYDSRGESKVLPVEWPPETLEAFGPDFVEWMRACQARKPGDPAPATPKAYIPVGGTAVPAAADLGAVEALRQILKTANGPIRRDDVVNHPLWAGRGITSTLTAALKQGQDAGWIVKNGQARATTFEMSAAERERLDLVAAETAGEQ